MALTRNYPSVASIEVSICSASVNQNPKKSAGKKDHFAQNFFLSFLRERSVYV